MRAMETSQLERPAVSTNLILVNTAVKAQEMESK